MSQRAQFSKHIWPKVKKIVEYAMICHMWHARQHMILFGSRPPTHMPLHVCHFCLVHRSNHAQNIRFDWSGIKFPYVPGYMAPEQKKNKSHCRATLFLLFLPTSIRPSSFSWHYLAILTHGKRCYTVWCLSGSLTAYGKTIWIGLLIACRSQSRIIVQCKDVICITPPRPSTCTNILLPCQT